MSLRKMGFLLIAGLLLACLLAACGNEAAPSAASSGGSATTTGGEVAPTSNPGTTRTNPIGGIFSGLQNTPGTETPKAKTTSAASPTETTPTPPSKSKGAAAGASSKDPCQLFTREDFQAVLGKEANDPDKWGNNEDEVCDYQFAESPDPSSDVAFGLELSLLKNSYDKEKFQKNFGLLMRGMQRVEGIGDEAYIELSHTSDSGSHLLVLRGSTVFTLELLVPATVADNQKTDELKAAAARILNRL